MSVLNIIYTILISPLQLFFEMLYMMANKVIDNPGMSIIVLSLAMNFLVLPLYKRADAMQEEERDIEAKLHDGVRHIKKTFKGDERMMILQAYYRQNDYKPTYVFKGAISLFLEIPFFIAAYQFLSHLETLRGVQFGILRDLGAADALLTVGDWHINLLPIIMTAVNLVSCIIFTKGYPTKTKVQLYSMAIFFFFFLYSSPSGLVFYWTLNNLFSLVKTIFYKLKNAKTILRMMFAAAGVGLITCAICFLDPVQVKRYVGVIALGVAFMLPLVGSIIGKFTNIKFEISNLKANRKVFISGAFFMVVLIGCVIPSAVIKASPQEFVDVYCYSNPLWYVCSSFCLAIGTFLVWLGVFYWLAGKKEKVFFEIGIWCACGIATVNYMFFGKNLGILSNILKYETGLQFSRQQQLINLGIILAVVIVMYVVYRFVRKLVPQILVIASLALAGMSIYNVVHINSSVSELADAVEQAKNDTPSFSLSKTGKNVIVLMMDRGMNEYIPYLMNERPELKEMFSGFTYYANTVSFGGYTNFGTPALFGGYEYTPVELNKRDMEPLASKQNEALKVMPALFDQNGYNVTVCDPTYANYQWTPDTSIYNAYPDIKTYLTNGRFADQESKERTIVNNKRNFFCYSMMKAVPISLQSIIYDDGNYNRGGEVTVSDRQTRLSPYTSEGTDVSFRNAYTVLENLPKMTEITEGTDNTFLMMTNDTTHEPMLLQEPDYVPAEHVDNTAYEAEHADRFTVDGKILHMETDIQYMHYQSNMASMLKIGEWLEYLKKNNVYDNTRIIIVADHGRPLNHLDDMVLDDGSDALYNTEFYYPLLLVKDFDSTQLTTSEEFMTNGDVPTLAFDGLIDKPTNPFTGKIIDNSEKYAHDQYVLGSQAWDTNKNNGNAYLPGLWFSVHDDMRKKENWTVMNDNAIMPFK